MFRSRSLRSTTRSPPSAYAKGEWPHDATCSTPRHRADRCSDIDSDRDGRGAHTALSAAMVSITSCTHSPRSSHHRAGGLSSRDRLHRIGRQGNPRICLRGWESRGALDATTYARADTCNSPRSVAERCSVETREHWDGEHRHARPTSRTEPELCTGSATGMGADRCESGRIGGH